MGSSPRPQQLTITLDDGSRIEAVFDALPRSLQEDLLRQPFARSVADDQEDGPFLLLEWDDGWREVLRVGGECTGIERYYVISRQEQVGRLALATATDYPELVEVQRRPARLLRVTLGGTAELSPGRSLREGGKTDQHYELQAGPDSLAHLRRALLEAARAAGVDLDAVAERSGALAPEQAETLRRSLHLTAFSRQQDVLDFVAYLARTAREAEPA